MTEEVREVRLDDPGENGQLHTFMDGSGLDPHISGMQVVTTVWSGGKTYVQGHDIPRGVSGREACKRWTDTCEKARDRGLISGYKVELMDESSGKEEMYAEADGR